MKPSNLKWASALLLGLASLAAHVDDLCTVHVADIHGLKDHREYVKKQVQDYDLVGLTAMSFQYQEALALARIAKDSGAQTVFGGYHPTLAAEEIGQSDDSQLIDYIVRGEGEATFRELTESMLAGREFKGISGLSYHDQGSSRMIHNPARPLLDVSDIKMPNRDARCRQLFLMPECVERIGHVSSSPLDMHPTKLPYT